MNKTGFYSRKKQFFREWRILWRIHGLDTFLGGVYVLAGFYAFHQVGRSQVYDVITPFIVASIVAGYLAFAIHVPQSTGKTLPYYFNLPRSRTVAWDAHLSYLVCAVLWMEGLILVGATLKLGGAGITPHYRLHLEAFVLPFLVIASVSSYAQIRHSRQYIALAILAIVLFSTGLYYWLSIGFWEDAEELNDFFPSRGFAPSIQYASTVLLLVSAAFVLALSRFYWKRREVGEIQ